MFCKDDCKGQNILIETADVRDERGRYSIEYQAEHGDPVLSVSISKLTESDSGQYSCGLGGSLSSVSYIHLRIIVVDALLGGNDDPAQLKHFYKETGSSLTVGCYFTDSGGHKYFCRGECGGNNILLQTYDVRAQLSRYIIEYSSGVLYVSITQLTKSDSGRDRCYLSGSFRDFEVTVTDAAIPSPSLPFTTTTELSERPTSTGVLLYGIICLLTFLILSSLAVLIIGIKMTNTGLRTRGNSEGTNMEDVHYENCTPGSTREDSTYQSLHPATRDQDQTYSTLTHHT
ncbi:unnamed protein product [Oreochromis niloticus]|nr:unnamed protein product [Mustela putorius furo]